MAVLSSSFSSKVLDIRTSFHVILPEEFEGRLPVLYLLHGLSDDDTSWLQNSSIARYANKMAIAIVMPQVQRSFYADMVEGGAYWTFLSEELPALIQRWFPISQKKEETFVAGLSMGGYGALKWGLNYPEKFAGIASISGAVDLVGLWKDDASRNREFTRIFGSLEELEGSQSDLVYLMNQVKGQSNVPEILQICGREDFLYHYNVKFSKQLADLDFDSSWIEAQGTHNWEFWDYYIQTVLEWIETKLKK
ncbi:alpha/beta hydrolase [Carnobacterium gallinarum]|uniref:alpha/beta hydrolase n=1 Tax=Carnobacterium gallinarum TaxID=2749 RepID=UPI0005540E25|nr:alpha/beta hydrolase family protein [Carnobacterium gallinarum]